MLYGNSMFKSSSGGSISCCLKNTKWVKRQLSYHTDIINSLFSQFSEMIAESWAVKASRESEPVNFTHNAPSCSTLVGVVV